MVSNGKENNLCLESLPRLQIRSKRKNRWCIAPSVEEPLNKYFTLLPLDQAQGHGNSNRNMWEYVSVIMTKSISRAVLAKRYLFREELKKTVGSGGFFAVS